MGGLAWTYLLIGEVFVLLALGDRAIMARLQPLARQVKWWIPYALVALVVLAWPPAALVLALVPEEE
jgi:hypothetical protein